MNKPPRKHHYIPQCYLKRFTSQGYLTVISLQQNRVFKATPEEVGHERDFFKLDADEEQSDPYRLEKDMGVAEAQFSLLLDEIEHSQILPPRNSVELDVVLMNFAKIHAASPGLRKHLATYADSWLKEKSNEILEDPEAFRAFCAKEEIDLDGPGMPSTAEVIQRIKKGDFTYEFPQVWHILHSLKV